jgi:hypothetical protein
MAFSRPVAPPVQLAEGDVVEDAVEEDDGSRHPADDDEHLLDVGPPTACTPPIVV